MDDTAAAGIGIVFVLFMLIIAAFYIFCMWRIYEKAGEPGWAVIVPFYNVVVLLKMGGKPWWWLLLAFIPFVGPFIFWVLMIITWIAIAERFGKTAGYGIGLALLGVIFIPMLAFSDAQYQA